MNIQIKRFDPSVIEPNRVLLFIGKRNTGKSTLVKDIMWFNKNIPIGMIMSPTEESNSFYKSMIPDLFIYNDYDPDAVDKLIKRQRKAVKKGMKDPNAFILLDDCMYDSKKITKDKNIRYIFMNGRHVKLMLYLTMQYCMDLSPDLRANIDYVFVLRENILANKEKIYKNFFGIFPTFDIFNQVMTKCTENFECLVLDNTSRSNEIEDVVFYYKATVRGHFRVGSAAFWQHHKKHYNPHHDDSDEEERSKKKKIKDAGASKSNNKKPVVTITKRM